MHGTHRQHTRLDVWDGLVRDLPAPELPPLRTTFLCPGGGEYRGIDSEWVCHPLWRLRFGMGVVAQHGPEDVEASSGPGQDCLSVVFALGALAVVVGAGCGIKSRAVGQQVPQLSHADGRVQSQDSVQILLPRRVRQ